MLEGSVQQALQKQGCRHPCAAHKALDDEAAAVPPEQAAPAAGQDETRTGLEHSVLESHAACVEVCTMSVMSDSTLNLRLHVQHGHLSLLGCIQMPACSRGAPPRLPGTPHEQAPTAEPGARQPALAQYDAAPASARVRPAAMRSHTDSQETLLCSLPQDSTPQVDQRAVSEDGGRTVLCCSWLIPYPPPSKSPRMTSLGRHILAELVCGLRRQSLLETRHRAASTPITPSWPRVWPVKEARPSLGLPESEGPGCRSLRL